MAKEKREVKLDTVEGVLEKLNKDYGKGTVMSSKFLPAIDVISTGSIELDLATGIGGVPKRKVTELIGWESSGKSTICLCLIANTQKEGKKALLIDPEHGFDKVYAKTLGVDIEELIVSPTPVMEHAYTIAEKLMDTGEFGIVVIDSQTALKPLTIVEAELGKSTIGVDARMMGQAVLKMVHAAWRNNVAIVFVSQLREKIGVMFGNPETTSGGNALRFYTHMRIDIRKTVIKEGEVAHHNKTKCKVIKNKMARPFGLAEFDIIFGEGIDRVGEIVKLAVESDIIQKSGSWYSYKETKLGQGEDGIRKLFEDNPELTKEIEEQVKFKAKVTYDESEDQEINGEGDITTISNEGSSSNGFALNGEGNYIT